MQCASELMSRAHTQSMERMPAATGRRHTAEPGCMGGRALTGQVPVRSHMQRLQGGCQEPTCDL